MPAQPVHQHHNDLDFSRVVQAVCDDKLDMLMVFWQRHPFDLNTVISHWNGTWHTLLTLAIIHQSKNCVVWLIDKKADVNQSVSENIYPISLAVLALSARGHHDLSVQLSRHLQTHGAHDIDKPAMQAWLSAYADDLSTDHLGGAAAVIVSALITCEDIQIDAFAPVTTSSCVLIQRMLSSIAMQQEGVSAHRLHGVDDDYEARGGLSPV